MHFEVVIKHVWSCIWRPWLCKSAAHNWGCLERHLQTKIKSTYRPTLCNPKDSHDTVIGSFWGYTGIQRSREFVNFIEGHYFEKLVALIESVGNALQGCHQSRLQNIFENDTYANLPAVVEYLWGSTWQLGLSDLPPLSGVHSEMHLRL